jgi:hypothetical protein
MLKNALPRGYRRKKAKREKPRPSLRKKRKKKKSRNKELAGRVLHPAFFMRAGILRP